MPTISYRILATVAQREEILRDFKNMFDALDDALDADFDVITGLVADPELEATWIEIFGESTDADEAKPEGAELKVKVREYRIGSISGLAMNFGELLTTRDKEPAEPLMRQVLDDPGTPRVPWHVEVRP